MPRKAAESRKAVKVTLIVHPDGLHPLEAVKAYYKYTDEDGRSAVYGRNAPQCTASVGP